MPVKAARRPLAAANGKLRARLEELEETLRAIRSGEVDALVVESSGGDQVFTLKSADQTYRLMVEQMQKGAATLSDDFLTFATTSSRLRTMVSIAENSWPISSFDPPEIVTVRSPLLSAPSFDLSAESLRRLLQTMTATATATVRTPSRPRTM